MCSYNAVQGIPTCLSPLMRNARASWNFTGYVTSDSDSVACSTSGHHYTANGSIASCLALRSGHCDIDSGDTYNDNLLKGVQEGLCSLDDVRDAAFRSLRIRFELGLFDPIADQPHWQHTPADVGSPLSARLSLNASERGLVLTKHQGDVLPLSRGKRIAVIGPHAQGKEVLIQPYPFMPACGSPPPTSAACTPDGPPCLSGLPCLPSGHCPPANASDPMFCVPSIAEALQAYNTGGQVTVTPGSNLFSELPGGISAAVAAAQAADTVVLTLGITTYDLWDGPKTPQGVHTIKYCSFNKLDFWQNQTCADGFLELEAHDRLSIGLPPAQHALAAAVLALNKPTVLVLLHGGAVAYAQEQQHTGPLAIVDAFYPGALGGPALARALFGLTNRWGRMPYTVYDDAWVNTTLMSQHDLSKDGGRTYRFYRGQPVAAFGSGLSLTSFALSLGSPAEVSLSTAAPATTAAVSVAAKNTGSRLGDVVVTAMLQPTQLDRTASTAVQPPPLTQALWQYTRLEDVAPGASASHTFTLGLADIALTDTASGDIVAMPGVYTLVFSDGSGAAAGTVTVRLTVTGSPLVLEPFPSKKP